jgi:ubiquitin-conjugating enzyme E2 A
MSLRNSGTSQAMLRLMGDLKEIKTDPPEGVSASPVNDNNLFVWNATILGPDDTPWEGGIYSLRIVFTDEYPSKPPKEVRFTTEMFHPNIYPDGTLCLDIIQDKWSPTYTVSSLLASVQSLLTDPNPNSPANPEAARYYEQDKKEYNKRVRRCALHSVDSSNT